MPRERDSESGKYDLAYTESDVLTVLSDTRLATREVADALGCHRSTALAKLRSLEEQDRVASTSAGRTLIWERID
jgi:DNA-binding MarR family transcriptional regulator